MKKLAIAFSSLGLLTAAHAGDLPRKAIQEVPPPIVLSFHGLYAGMGIGYGWGSNDPTLNVLDSILVLPGSQRGFIGGIYTGYNYQMNPYFVLGVETDFSGSTISGNQTQQGKVDQAPYIVQAHESLNWLSSIRGRFGFSPWHNVMFYGTGGGAVGGVNVTSSACAGCSSLNASFATSSQSTGAKWGWIAGAGVEYAYTPNVLVRAEWLYFDLANTETNFGSVSNQGNLARLGIAYKF